MNIFQQSFQSLQTNKMKKLSFYLVCSIFIHYVNSWCLRTIFSGKDSIQSVDFSPDGEYIITGQKSGRVMQWKTDTLEILKTYSFGHRLWQVVYSKDQSLIAVAGQDDNIHLLSASSLSLQQQIDTNHGKVYDVDFTYDSNNLLTCGDDQKSKLWNVTNLSTIYKLHQVADQHKAYTCQYGDNDWFGVAGDFFVEAYDNYTNSSISQYYKLHNHATQTFFGLCIRPGGSYGITLNQAGDLIQFLLNSTNTDVTLTGTSGALYSCDYSRDATYFAVGGTGMVYLYNADSRANTLEATFDTNTNFIIRSVRFSKDSNKLLASSQNGTVYFYQRFCHGCPPGFYPNKTACRKCSQAIVGCSMCINSSSCQSCMYGYYVSSSTCKTCDIIDGCANCNSSSNCTICLTGYYKTGLTCTRCLSALYGCQQCVNGTYCLECDRNTYLINGSCILCTTISQCIYCNSSTFCLQCRSGYYESAGTCTICQSAANPYCIVCQSSLNCTKCMSGYRVNSSNLCQKCSPQCLFCNNTNHCFDCAQQMYVTSTFSCSFCIHPCLTCNSSTYCHSCVSGFYLSASGVCSNCPAPCLSCNTSSYCQECNVGYYLDTSNNCVECKIMVPNCRECNETNCLVCETNYQLSGGACSQCNTYMNNCAICNSTNICQSCITGYYASGATGANSCVTCQLGCSNCMSATECSVCKPGYYLSSQDCFLCSNKCLTCTSSTSTSCTSCIQGFYLSSTTTGSCLSCSGGISRCASCLNSSYCMGCNVGSYLSSPTTCTACTHPCTSCNTSNTDCMTCALGYYLYTSGGVGACGACAYGCSECSSSGTICLNCIQGYYYNSVTFTCIQCKISLPGCSACSSASTCIVCTSGYYPVGTSCTACSLNISHCLRCSTSGTLCTLCDYGYALNPTNTSCQFCASFMPNCEHCSSSTYCQTCKSMFYSNSGTCSSCSTGCLSCYNNTYCEVCVDQYILLTTKTCQLCEDLMVGCRLCTSTSVCTDCVVGYYLDTATCHNCQMQIQGCLHCSDATTCLQCNIFYQHQPTNTCTICSSLYPDCQICSNTTAGCLQCQVGYYLTTTGTCAVCSLTSLGCIKCSSNTTCLQCQSGYFLNSTSSLCQVCQSKFSACIFCKQAACQQCEGGYYLNAGGCSACPREGCEVCDQDNSLLCVGCNTRYYLVVDQCLLCSAAMPQCLQCRNSSICLTCSIGYYLTPTQTCNLCSSLYPGCITCTPSACVDCMSNYFLNTTDLHCHNCTDFVVGCSFCLNQYTCISCQNGYYLQNNTCQYCPQIKGCLYCLNQTECLYCVESHFLSSNDSKCYECKYFLPGCYACDSNLTCLSCYGHFRLISGECQVIKGQVLRKYEEVGIKSIYVDQNTLMHTLYLRGITFAKVQQNWQVAVQLTLISKNYTYYLLTIKQVKWSDSLTELYFFTNNPIADQLSQSMKGMPFIKSQARLLAATSADLDFNLKLKIDEHATHQIMPDLSHMGDLYLDYPYSDSGFYESLISNQKYYYHFFGVAVTLFLLIGFTLKICYLLPDTKDRGELSAHIFAFKAGAIAVYPTYGQYVNYCYGFMTADLPWFNQNFGSILGNPNDKSPEAYRMYYTNLSLGSTYFFAFICISFTWFVLSLISAFCQSYKKQIEKYKSFLFNFFLLGATIAGSLSLQGIITNPLDSLSANTVLYVFGIVIYIGIFFQISYSWAVGQSESLAKLKTNEFDDIGLAGHLQKLRIYIKATLLSVMHLGPLYFISAIFCIELAFILADYYLFWSSKSMPKTQLMENILLNTGLVLIILVPDALIGLIFASLIIIGVLVVQFCKVCSENKNKKQKILDEITLEQKISSKKRNFAGINSNEITQFERERRNEDSIAKLQSFNPTPKIVMKKKQKPMEKIDFSIEQLQY